MLSMIKCQIFIFLLYCSHQDHSMFILKLFLCAISVNLKRFSLFWINDRMSNFRTILIFSRIFQFFAETLILPYQGILNGFLRFKSSLIILQWFSVFRYLSFVSSGYICHTLRTCSFLSHSFCILHTYHIYGWFFVRYIHN